MPTSHNSRARHTRSRKKTKSRRRPRRSRARSFSMREGSSNARSRSPVTDQELSRAACRIQEKAHLRYLDNQINKLVGDGGETMVKIASLQSDRARAEAEAIPRLCPGLMSPSLLIEFEERVTKFKRKRVSQLRRSIMGELENLRSINDQLSQFEAAAKAHPARFVNSEAGVKARRNFSPPPEE